MAIEANLNQKDEEQDQQQAGSGPITSQTSGQMAGQATGPSRPATPSGKPNIQSYLKANTGAGEQLAGRISQNVQKQGQQFGQQVAKTQAELAGQVNPLESKLGDTNLIQTAFKDPNAILQNEEQKSAFGKLRDQGYAGDISNVANQAQQQQSQLQSQLGSLGQTAQSAQTESGRFGLLRKAFGQPGYSSGQQKLDQLFLQAQPGVNRNLQQNLGQVATQAQQQLGTASGEINKRLEALTKLSGDQSSAIRNLLTTGELGGQELGQGTEDIKTAAQQRLTKVQEDLKALQGLQQRAQTPGQLTSKDLEALGLSNLSNPYLKGISAYDVNINDAIKSLNLNPSLTQVADPAQVQRFAQLNELLGGTQQNPFNPSETAGQFKPVELSQDLASKINERRDYYENQLLNQLKNQSAQMAQSSQSDVVQRRALNPVRQQFEADIAKAKSADELQAAYDRLGQNYAQQQQADILNTLRQRAYGSTEFGTEAEKQNQYNRMVEALKSGNQQVLGGEGKNWIDQYRATLDPKQYLQQIAANEHQSYGYDQLERIKNYIDLVNKQRGNVIGRPDVRNPFTGGTIKS